MMAGNRTVSRLYLPHLPHCLPHLQTCKSLFSIAVCRICRICLTSTHVGACVLYTRHAGQLFFISRAHGKQPSNEANEANTLVFPLVSVFSSEAKKPKVRQMRQTDMEATR